MRAEEPIPRRPIQTKGMANHATPDDATPAQGLKEQPIQLVKTQTITLGRNGCNDVFTLAKLLFSLQRTKLDTTSLAIQRTPKAYGARQLMATIENWMLIDLLPPFLTLQLQR
ncbi:MAG: hypothetical protein WCD81_05470 [Candidatus Bathyarchaeia archaeon]